MTSLAWPDRVCLELLDDKMQAGYAQDAEHNVHTAAVTWLDAWADVLRLCDAAGISSIEEFDDRFPLTQSLYNWNQDLEMPLENAGRDDGEMRQALVDFCEESLRRFPRDEQAIRCGIRPCCGADLTAGPCSGAAAGWRRKTPGWSCYRGIRLRCEPSTEAVKLLYCRNVASDVWVGAVTTLAGAVLGGAISFILSRQQIRDARLQREEEEVRQQRRRSADRRFQAYSEFLTRARSFRNALETYYLHPRHKPSVDEIDSILQSANDASALVFLVVESDNTYQGCRIVLQALERARNIIHGIEPSDTQDPWAELNVLLGRATREFQNSAREELGVSGPAEPWDSPVQSQ